MAHELIPFNSLDWQQGGHPLERKKTAPERPVGLISFAPGFRDPNPCTRAHAGYVLRGCLTFEFEDAAIEVRAGEGFAIDAGTAHRAANPGHEDAVLFIVSDQGASTPP